MKKNFKMLFVILAVLMLAVIAVGCSSSEEPAVQPASSEGSQAAAPQNTFPEKDIVAVYTSKVGSGGDIFLRNLGKAIEPHMNGNSLVVENRVGASGGTAMAYVSNSDPDGYTLLGTSTTIVLASVLTDVPVTYEDFKYIGGLVLEPEYFYSAADAPYNDITELVDYANAHPGEMNWGFPQATSSEALAQMLLIQESGIDVNTVVFESGTECFTSLLGGHIDVSVGGYSDFKAQYEAGKIKVLATLLPESTKQFPDVKSMKDQGYPTIATEKARGLVAPKDTPDEVVEQLSAIFKTAYDDEQFVSTLEDDGVEIKWLSGEEMKASYDTIAKLAEENLK